MEKWLPVVEWEDVYEVSNMGNVRRIKPGRNCGHILCPSQPQNQNRTEVHLADGNRHKTIRTHRLVTAAFIGPCPEGHQVNHKDGNGVNNRLDNLEYVTAAYNILHSYRVLGRRRVKPKLSEKDVADIRALKGTGISQDFIAKKFGCSQMHVCRIMRNEQRTYDVDAVALSKTWT